MESMLYDSTRLPVHPSVCPSRVDQSITVEVRIMQLYHRVAKSL